MTFNYFFYENNNFRANGELFNYKNKLFNKNSSTKYLEIY